MTEKVDLSKATRKKILELCLMVTGNVSLDSASARYWFDYHDWDAIEHLVTEIKRELGQPKP